MKITNLQCHLLLLLATTLVAGSFLASEKLSGVISPVSLTLLRFSGAALLMLPLVISNSKWRTKVIATMPRAMVISLFFSLFFICLFESLKTTTALNTGALYTLVPLVTAVLGVLILKSHINSNQIGIYLIGAAGTCWVIFNGDLNLLLTMGLNQGDLLFMVGIVLMCCYSISMKLLYRNDEMMVLVFCILLGGSIWMALALLILQQSPQWNQLDIDSIYYMAYLVVAATLSTVYIFQKTTVILGPSRVNAYIYLNPAFVAILLFFIDGIAIPLVVIPGILISSMATFILQKEHAAEHNRAIVNK